MSTIKKLKEIEGVTLHRGISIRFVTVYIDEHSVFSYREYDDGTILVYPHHKYFQNTKVIPLNGADELIKLVNTKKEEIENDFATSV